MITLFCGFGYIVLLFVGFMLLPGWMLGFERYINCFAEAYLHTLIQKIRTYSLAQFDHWTKEPFSSNFRKMLTLEQYRDPKLAQRHHDYLAGGPLEYMAAIFRKLAGLQ